MQRKGRIKQGLWTTTFGGVADLPGMCQHAVRLGAHGFDMLGPGPWPLLRRFGLTPTIAGPGAMNPEMGIVHAQARASQLDAMTAHAKVCAEAGVRRFGINAGQRRGLSNAKAADNAVELLKRLKDTLEKLDVTVCIENVNDRRPGDTSLGRQDMVFGHWDWGMEVVARVGSSKVKLLCDIYHLQIMDGDVVWRIRDSIGSIGHFHVAGVPTRNEIDEGQELNYHHIAQVIAELPYEGYVSHEWSPSRGRDPLECIARSMQILDA